MLEGPSEHVRRGRAREDGEEEEEEEEEEQEKLFG